MFIQSCCTQESQRRPWIHDQVMMPASILRSSCLARNKRLEYLVFGNLFCSIWRSDTCSAPRVYGRFIFPVALV